MKSIRNRNIKIQLWLNKAEARNLQEKARRSRLSVAAYLRQLINGVVPKEAPPPDFFSMMRELHYIGNNLNQIAMKAHALNAIDAKHYDDGVRLFEDAVQKILSAVLDPVPMEQTHGRYIHLACSWQRWEGSGLCGKRGENHRRFHR